MSLARLSLNAGAGAAVLGAALAGAETAHAHGFGARYDLPLPLDMYLWGAGLTVALSFIFVGLFLRGHDESRRSWKFDLLGLPFLRLMGVPAILEIFRVLSVALFLLIVVAGFIGDQNPFKNPAPTAVWILWWVGLAYISALVGPVWAALNPIATLFRWAEAIRPISRDRPYPERWGRWPAVILFFGFAWAELVWHGADHPVSLSAAILLYSAITWTGMAIFGRETWLDRGEVFHIVFGLFARFAPLAGPGEEESRALYVRPYANGLLVRTPVGFSTTVLAVAVLAIVSFDGFAETSGWKSVFEWSLEAPVVSDILRLLNGFGLAPGIALQNAALILVPGLFLVVFLAFCRLMNAAAGGRTPTTTETAGLFVLTLVPIAIAYHLSHYLSYLLIGGQYMIPIASDPFGYGWDLFGTKLYLIDIGIVTAKTVWWASVSAIVAGHMVAVYLAHRMALRVYATARSALMSQVPMIVLMIAYTMVSLWIIAQPIVNE